MEWYIDMGDHITAYLFRITYFAIGVYFFTTVNIGARASVYLKSRLHNYVKDGVCPYKVEPWSGV